MLGAIACVALLICSRNWVDRGGTAFLVSLGVAGLTYLLAVREFLCTHSFPRRVVVIGLVLAAAWHVPFLWAPPGVDDDIHRYVWDGRVQRLGLSPYAVVPSDPKLRNLHTSQTRGLNNPDLPSPYPAGAQLFFRGVTWIHESTFTLKIAFLICDFAIALVLLDMLRQNRQEPHLVLLYAWNPLLAIEVAGSGHIDIVGALLLVISFAALGRRWRAIAGMAFGLAVAVKLLPIVLLPLYWKRIRVRHALLALTAVAVLYLPFLKDGALPIGSLLTYVQTWRFNDLVFAKLEQAAPQIAAGIPVVIGFAVAVWLRMRSQASSAEAFAWPMAASLLSAPVVYPWYLLWLTPFLRSASTLPIVIWTVSIIPTYVVWHRRTLGYSWTVPGWGLEIEYGAVALAGILVALLQVRQSAMARRSVPQHDRARP